MNSLKHAGTVEKWLELFHNIGQSERGVSRLGYSPEEDEMHKTLKIISEQEGFEVNVDAVGNSFVSKKGLKANKFILIGSHLDSVPQGGRYDGVAGVISGLLILKWIKEKGIDIPLKVAAFRCEESSRFGRETIGSGFATGFISEDEVKRLKNKNGQNLYDILKSKGYSTNGQLIEGVTDFIELHIEQGRVLWETRCDVGIVTSIAAPIRFNISILGRQDHSGATPMNMRKDALCGAAEVVLSLESIAKSEIKNKIVATVGIIKNTANAINIIPGSVELGAEIRGINKNNIRRVADTFLQEVERIVEERGLNYGVELISSSEPIQLDKSHIIGLEKTAAALGISYRKLHSGAGHDAMRFASKVRTAMVFIPCVEGISHSPEEFANSENIIKGSLLVFEYLKKYSEDFNNKQ